MDVAKYIGLFLLKNHFCYVHGLGNLELKRKPATYNGEVLQPSQYEVILTPGGSIDDNLANFIATNEQISISKAANALRDFSTESKAALHAGKEVPIPAIGKFTENEGRLFFVSDPHLQFTPPGMPAMKVAKRLEKSPDADVHTAPLQTPQPGYKAPAVAQDAAGIVNWGRVILAAVVLCVVIAGAVMAYKYIKNRNQAGNARNQAAAMAPDTAVKPSLAVPIMPPHVDSNAALAPMAALSYNVEIDAYDNKGRAEKRVKQMISYGHNVKMVEADSATYLIIIPVTTTERDTTKVLDSLSHLFNPSGVSVYVK